LAALVSGVAWLRAGFAEAVLVGGAEAPLTPFTLAQMQALGIYSPLSATDAAPCRPLAQAQTPTNTFVLAEGAALFRLVYATQPPPTSLARLVGWGWGNERIPSPTGISPSAHNLQQAMRCAAQMSEWAPVDVLLAHAPGTRQGDTAEWAAIQAVWQAEGQAAPPVYPIKWQTGHALGAAGALSLATAVGLLAGETLPVLPYPALEGVGKTNCPWPIRRVMVNSAGFGGNAISVILEQV
jgi:3-oxoacyl-(acyl-carrier-protein) synthase